MQLYDPKFVHFEWSDKLDGQYCFVADNIDALISKVNTNDTCQFLKVSKSDNESCPFEYVYKNEISGHSRFAYYDSNYNVKYAYLVQHKEIYYKLRGYNKDWVEVMSENIFKSMIDDPDYEFKIVDDFTELREAYKQGKTIQHMNLDGDWVDCDMPVSFVANHSYRIKPEEMKGCTLNISDKGFGDVDEEYVEKIKTLFKNGETIAYRPFNGTMWNLISKYTDGECDFNFSAYEYKVVTDLLTDTTAISRKDLEEDNDISHKIRDTIQASLSTSDLYRPFKDTDELIAYWDKHYGNGNRPEYTMPLIWVKKDTGNVFLITGYDKDEYVCLSDDWWLSMKELFEQCEFLDGNCCGKVKE